MSSEKKPWMTPIGYNDDRFVEPDRDGGSPEFQMPRGDGDGRRSGEDEDDRQARDVEDILRRPDRAREEREYECNDTSPVDYRRGPHDEELGVDEKDFGTPDPDPVPYGNGEHEDELGVDDDEPQFDD